MSRPIILVLHQRVLFGVIGKNRAKSKSREIFDRLRLILRPIDSESKGEYNKKLVTKRVTSIQNFPFLNETGKY